jgi:hypothetical protein
MAPAVMAIDAAITLGNRLRKFINNLANLDGVRNFAPARAEPSSAKRASARYLTKPQNPIEKRGESVAMAQAAPVHYIDRAGLRGA